MQQSRKHRISKHCAIKSIGVGSTPVFSETFYALTVIVIVVRKLPESGGERGDQESGRVDRTFESQREFLSRCQRNRIQYVSRVKFRNNPQDSLVFLLSELPAGAFPAGGFVFLLCYPGSRRAHSLPE